VGEIKNPRQKRKWKTMGMGLRGGGRNLGKRGSQDGAKETKETIWKGDLLGGNPVRKSKGMMTGGLIFM